MVTSHWVTDLCYALLEPNALQPHQSGTNFHFLSPVGNDWFLKHSFQIQINAACNHIQACKNLQGEDEGFVVVYKPIKVISQ